MPIQRISTDFWGSLDHTRRAETAERATWGTKTPPPTPHSRHPTRPGLCAAETTALGPTGAHLGGLPGGGAPAAGELSPGLSYVAMHKAPRSHSAKAQRHRSPYRLPPACRVTKNIKKAPNPIAHSDPAVCSPSLNTEHMAATVVTGGWLGVQTLAGAVYGVTIQC